VALAEGVPLAEALARDEEVTRHLDRAALARLTDPAAYLGAAGTFTDAVLSRVPSTAVRSAEARSAPT
jgi:3-carboxy-cis,cis-muconate cycloisomerase